ncbi:ABC transporter substrate-binding protein [Paenibacillus athensensis]|uniref:ABC transporter substrate-binding protein n=1 Tax=Paenibacillus athensensis TaxID=1967502 RepID=A0A4Y8QAW8_9BACL|nr:ABC transporter substrate-binding protein [Paenibacillus athensensis]MCD1257690.1 ABC transporter substrate-binding protein [Paenibacillus athensensis]
MKKLLLILFVGAIMTVMGCTNKTGTPSGTATSTATSMAVSTTDPAMNKELNVAAQDIAASLDPVKPLTSSYLRGIGAGEALFRVNAKGAIEPSLAESAKEIDPTTWEIKLRPKASFWSGKAVDAAAVIASLERSRSLDLTAKPYLDDLTFSKVDDFTIGVKTKRSHLQVPLNLSYYQTLIVNADAKQDSVDTMDLSGMYKVVEFVPKQKMVLELNKNYWGKAPVIPRIVYQAISDEQTRVLSALSGKSQVVLNIPATSLAQFKDNKEVRLSATPAANTQTIYLNLNKPQFADVKVRQALSWALDRSELVVLAAEGQSTPITTWLSSNPAYQEARNAVYTKTDLDKAGQLLDEAGWKKGSDGIRTKDGNPLTLRLMTWGGDKALGEALQSQWTKIGIKASVQHGDYSLIETARKSGDWDASIEAWNTFGDEYALLKGQFAPEGSANFGGYKDEETNKLLAQLAEAPDQAARHELALKINERVALQAPVISLFPRPQISAVSKSLQGFEDHFRQYENVVNANLTISSQ